MRECDNAAEKNGGKMVILKQKSWKRGEQRTWDNDVKAKGNTLELQVVNVYEQAEMKKCEERE